MKVANNQIIPVNINIQGTTGDVQKFKEVLADSFGQAPLKELTVDMTQAPPLDQVTRLFEQQKAAGANPHDLLRFLACLGVDVGWQGTYKGAFVPVALPTIDFGNQPTPEHLKPYAVAIQNLAATTKQLALGVDENGQAIDLRDACVKASDVAQKLIVVTQALSGKGKEAEVYFKAGLQAMDNMAELHNRLFYAMTDFVEKTKADLGMKTEGSWPVIKEDQGKLRLLYRNTFRGEHLAMRGSDAAAELTERTRKTEAAWQKFYSKGGTDADIRPLTREFFLGLEDGQLVEFAQRPQGIYVSIHPEAKHSHVAGNEDVASAGGAKKYTRPDGGIAFVIVNGKSGHFRAHEGSLQGVKQEIVEKAGIPPEMVLTCAGDFTDPSTVLALDIWRYKAENQGNITKELNAQMVADYEKLWEDQKQEAVQWLQTLENQAPSTH